MKSTKTDIFSLYKQLVDHLLSDSKNEKVIKELMVALGIEYKETQVDRLSAVLAFDPRNPLKGKMNDLR
jgi:hypothetical protein